MDAEAERRCSLCGRPTAEDSQAVQTVDFDELGRQRLRLYCGEHRPHTVTPEDLAADERQELEAGAMALRTQVMQIRDLMDLERPVTPIDRANIATILLRLHDRSVWLMHELRRLQGKPPIPGRELESDVE